MEGKTAHSEMDSKLCLESKAPNVQLQPDHPLYLDSTTYSSAEATGTIQFLLTYILM